MKEWDDFELNGKEYNAGDVLACMCSRELKEEERISMIKALESLSIVRSIQKLVN